MSNKYKKVENNPNLVRDTSSNALLNIDNKALEAYKMRKKAANRHNDKISKLENKINKFDNDINTVRNDMAEMKQLLYKLVEQKD